MTGEQGVLGTWVGAENLNQISGSGIPLLIACS